MKVLVQSTSSSSVGPRLLKPVSKFTPGVIQKRGTALLCEDTQPLCQWQQLESFRQEVGDWKNAEEPEFQHCPVRLSINKVDFTFKLQ